MDGSQKMNASTSGSVDARADWDAIRVALELLLPELDVSQLGKRAHLDSDTSERILHGLFLRLERKTWQRLLKAKTPPPSKTPQERAKFIESAVQFVNGQKLHSQLATASLFRMCGGAPYRQLLRSLIGHLEERFKYWDRHLPGRFIAAVGSGAANVGSNPLVELTSE